MTTNQLAGLMIALASALATGFKLYLDSKIELLRTEIRLESEKLQSKIKESENRLDQRINTRLIHN